MSSDYQIRSPIGRNSYVVPPTTSATDMLFEMEDVGEEHTPVAPAPSPVTTPEKAAKVMRKMQKEKEKKTKEHIDRERQQKYHPYSPEKNG